MKCYQYLSLGSLKSSCGKKWLLFYQCAWEDLNMRQKIHSLIHPLANPKSPTREALLEKSLSWELSGKAVSYGVCFQRDQPPSGPSPLAGLHHKDRQQLRRHEALQASFEIQLCHPTKVIIWEIFLGMFNCAENVFLLQSRGNEVAIWYGICNHNQTKFHGHFLFLSFC